MKKKFPNITSKIPPVVAIAAILIAWQLVSISGLLPSYMLPSPVAVCQALVKDRSTILFHAGFTLQESFYGLVIGVCLAFLFATMMDRFSILDQAFYPIMIITPDDTDHCDSTDSGSLDGVWYGTKDYPGSDHHIFPDYDRPFGWI